ncbi:hypothetical protein EX895_002473 [Sporisorium graminicola]|uniref:Uncharacterized protein n=1 Tax=Sporisorium graminicola TaxID=280036 RepID=A0A4U7KV10_9BASI|nr:hypothetical protein EX895_002473 [Sporisorium graminicola]TKY88485.1 hypothetical protein EX895_002473 [Sporisorium graminicola]
MLPSQGHGHQYGFETHTIHTPIVGQIALPSQQDILPYTPRSKSLDLLRSDAAIPVNARNSLDTLSTLKGHRISSPIFLNSSIGVKPLQQVTHRLDSPLILGAEFEQECGDAFTSCSTADLIPKAVAGNAKMRASTMPRYAMGARTVDNALEPNTPSRGQVSTDNLLKSKFSMSPVQPSKRSKPRNSEDRMHSTVATHRLPEGVLSQDSGRSALGNWSHSIGMAARKLQKSALPRKTSDESYQATTLEVRREVNEMLVVETPEKAKSSLKSATSLASIRRFITPSRRTRKFSSTRGIAAPRRAMLTVDDVVVERLTAASASIAGNEDTWFDADGRASRDGLLEPAEAPVCTASLIVPDAVTARFSRSAKRQADSDGVALRPLSPDFYDPPPQLRLPDRRFLEGIEVDLNCWSRSASPMPVPNGIDSHPQTEPAEVVGSVENKRVASGPGPSKLKTLQLLARRPFDAFGKKMREMEMLWWPSRGNSDLSRRLEPASVSDQAYCDALTHTQPTRRSEDLLSRASPRVCDTMTMAYKSRSVELDRIQLLPSKVVPLRSSAGLNYKRRPTIPDSFSVPTSQEPAPLRKDVQQSSVKQAPSAQARISDLRHPWMKQLQLPGSSLPTSGVPVASSNPGARPIWPKMDAEELVSQRNIVATVSLTAASIALRQNAPTKQSPRRPPASLLGQSLPIPPRSGRSRASTISSQSSTTSSPSGKVIVSRRSYGQRLRSPNSREETASIRSVGTSILFTESPPGSPGMRKLMSPYYVTRSPNTLRVRSPPTTVLLPKYSPRRAGKVGALRSWPSVAFRDDESDMGEEQEWMDEGSDSASTGMLEGRAYPSRLEEDFPTIRPGFLEMSEATQTLSNLVKTFSGSSGSLSLHSSPYKNKDTPDRNVTIGTRRGLYGIMEADEHSFVRSSPPPQRHLTRQRLISIASLVSTEANSSFEDTEELQRLLDSIMAADLGGGGSSSYETSGSRDMALLSPFGSPAEYKDPRTVDQLGSAEAKEEKNTPKGLNQLPPPPKFLLNDRPISPPGSCWMSDQTHSNCNSAGENADVGFGEPSTLTAASSASKESIFSPPSVDDPSTTPAFRIGTKSWSKAATTSHDDSGYASFSILERYGAPQS